MSVFIKVITTNDVTHLIIEGRPSDEELSEVWDRILETYLDNTFTDDDRFLMGLVATANLLHFQITKAEMILRYLDFRYDEDLVDILKRMGACTTNYPKAGSINEKKVWAKRVTANVKRWKHSLLETENEIKRLTPEGVDDKPVMASYFDDLFARISQYFHYHIDEKTVTVSRFLAMYREYKQYLFTLKKQAKTAS